MVTSPRVMGAILRSPRASSLRGTDHVILWRESDSELTCLLFLEFSRFWNDCGVDPIRDHPMPMGLTWHAH
jgi:hypothetical protein